MATSNWTPKQHDELKNHYNGVRELHATVKHGSAYYGSMSVLFAVVGLSVVGLSVVLSDRTAAVFPCSCLMFSWFLYREYLMRLKCAVMLNAYMNHVQRMHVETPDNILWHLNEGSKLLSSVRVLIRNRVI